MLHSKNFDTQKSIIISIKYVYCVFLDRYWPSRSPDLNPLDFF